MVTQDGFVKILDFGLAKLQGAAARRADRERRRLADAGRPHHRHARLHVARAGGRAAARLPLRPVLRRPRLLRDADAQAPLPPRDAGPDALRDHPGGGRSRSRGWTPACRRRCAGRSSAASRRTPTSATTRRSSSRASSSRSATSSPSFQQADARVAPLEREQSRARAGVRRRRPTHARVLAPPHAASMFQPAAPSAVVPMAASARRRPSPRRGRRRRAASASSRSSSLLGARALRRRRVRWATGSAASRSTRRRRSGRATCSSDP